MTSASLEILSWSRRRWCLSIFSILAIQLIVLLLLEKNSPEPRRSVSTPMLRLRQSINTEQMAVTDPTVFVLPHRHGFSGPAWLNRLPALDFKPADWTEPPRPLRFASSIPGVDFQKLLAVNVATQLSAIPAIPSPASAPTDFSVEIIPVDSSVSLADALAKRRLVSGFNLPSWKSAELIANSVVQLLVDAQGRTISAALLAPGIRLPTQSQADATALDLAKSAQFEPATPGTLTIGTLTFEWQTLPLTSTNSTSPPP